MQLFISRLRPTRLTVTAELIQAAGQASPVNHRVVKLLLSQASAGDHITDGAIAQMAKHFDGEILKRALSKRATMEESLKAAIFSILQHLKGKEENTELFLNRTETLE